MIKLSKLTDYAVLILVDMARQDRALLSAASLSASTSLPDPTVSKVLKLLVRRGVVKSVRGVHGGYSLALKPADVPVSQIIEAIEGPIALTDCVDGSVETCSLEGTCHVKGRWNPVNAAITTALEQVTLADMMPTEYVGATVRLSETMQHGAEA